MLFQSLFMIVAQVSTKVDGSVEEILTAVFATNDQLALLYICILYRPSGSPENLRTSTRPLSFWQWSTYTQYIEFLAGFMYVLQVCGSTVLNCVQSVSSYSIPHLRTV